MHYRYKYSARHKEIIDAAIKRGWTKSWCVENGIYVEAHHIFPRAEYPEWERASWNIVLLLPEEHYEIHRELALSNPDCDSANYAWWMMCTTTADAQGKREYEVSSEDYGEARRRCSGENNPSYIDGRSSNPDYFNKKTKEFYEQHPGYKQEQDRKYYIKNTERIKTKVKEWQDKNVDTAAEYKRKCKKNKKEAFKERNMELKPNSKYNPVRRVGLHEEYFSACDASWLLSNDDGLYDGYGITQSIKRNYTCGSVYWEYVPEKEQLGEQWYIDNDCKWCQDVSLN